MKEPKPRTCKAPTEEPLLRIGVILEEDRKTELTLQAPETELTVRYGSKEEKISAHSSFSVELEGDTVVVTYQDRELCRAEQISLLPSTKTSLAPKSGIAVSGVVAGRSFHWKKEITQHFPGELEVLPSKNGLIVVNLVPFEHYLACVISSEMSAECPVEFLKAQAIAARSWAYVFLHNKHQNKPYTICNDDDCQRYQGTTHLGVHCLTAIDQCRGIFLINPNNNVVPCYYSKSCGGKTESAKNCFGFDIPELISVSDASSEPGDEPWCSPKYVAEESLPKYLGAVDESGKYYRWQYQLSADLLLQNIRERFDCTEAKKVTGITAGERGESGRYLNFTVQYLTEAREEGELHLEDQYDIRKAFHESFLYSTAFEYQELHRSDGNLEQIHFQGSGWGHGVGLCQIGALGMALFGKTEKEILAHYYTGTTLFKRY